jgi:DNA gyrase inhibitor GyrI
VYYGGDESKWGDIIIDDLNDRLINATIHYNCVAIPQVASIQALTENIPSGQYAVIVMDSAGNYIKDAMVYWSDG